MPNLRKLGASHVLASLIARAIGKLDFKDNDTNAVRILYFDFFLFFFFEVNKMYIPIQSIAYKEFSFEIDL